MESVEPTGTHLYSCVRIQCLRRFEAWEKQESAQFELLSVACCVLLHLRLSALQSVQIILASCFLSEVFLSRNCEASCECWSDASSCPALCLLLLIPIAVSAPFCLHAFVSVWF